LEIGAVSQFILNFHGVGPVTRDIDDGERDCWLDLDFFDAVLDLVQGATHVKLTFDDGNSSDCDVVLPFLLGRGLKSDFFICADRLDQPGFLSRIQVRQLQSEGMHIGSHGAAHIPWRRLPPNMLRAELIDSRRALEEVCAVAVDTAACPFGSYDRQVLRGRRQAGYRSVYTSDGGASSAGGWLQPRTSVTRSMTMPSIQRLVHRGTGLPEQCAINLRAWIKRLR
jgi:peptidoglycan/xylan/chitin deacetylase (PgdA/CDA1 family)